MFTQQLRAAKQRGLQPRCVCFDSWYSSLNNLKLLRALGWTWLCRLKANRQVRVDFAAPQALRTVDVPSSGRVVHLVGYGPIRAFRVVATNGDTDHGATSDLAMDALTRLQYGEYSWRIEEYHRGLKQYCGVEGCQARRAAAQRNHIGLSIRAFLRLEGYCFSLGISWFQGKLEVIRQAVRTYLANPYIGLPQAA